MLGGALHPGEPGTTTTGRGIAAGSGRTGWGAAAETTAPPGQTGRGVAAGTTGRSELMGREVATGPPAATGREIAGKTGRGVAERMHAGPNSPRSQPSPMPPRRET